VLVEGFKGEAHPKLEVHRPALGKSPLYAKDGRILAVATDGPLDDPHPLRVDLNDADAAADVVLAHAQPLDIVIALLERG
jgi:molybdopterin-guanine dinucleotide biosynthesis protein B